MTAPTTALPLTVDRVEVARLLGVSPRTVDRLRNNPRFPKPIDLLGHRRPKWSRRAIEQFIDGELAAA